MLDLQCGFGRKEGTPSKSLAVFLLACDRRLQDGDRRHERLPNWALSRAKKTFRERRTHSRLTTACLRSLRPPLVAAAAITSDQVREQHVQSARQHDRDRQRQ